MVILPVAAFAVIVINILLAAGSSIIRTFLRASLVMGALIVLSNVLLSLIKALTTLNLALFWGLVFLACLGWMVARLRKGVSFPPLPGIGHIGTVDWIMMGMILIIVLVTLVVALVAPVQTYDSLTYHMSRVAHWVQNRSVSIYPTGIERQADMGPFAEFAVLHLYILQRGDLFVNLVDWSAFVGCIVASACIAGQLGADRRGRLIAGVFAATLPMAIAQASSTMTDIVVAFLVLAMIVEMLDLVSLPGSLQGWIYLGLAAGLAILTKATAVAFIIPFLVWLGFSILRRKMVRRVVLAAVVSLIMVIVINLFTWTQNYLTYHDPIGSPALIAYHANQVVTPAVLVSNVSRNIYLNLASNNDAFNLFTLKVMVKIHQWIGLDPSDPRTTLGEFFLARPSLSEGRLGNPYHLFLLFVCILVALFFFKTQLRWYVLSAIFIFMLFSIGNKTQVFALRLQAPFFIIAAAVVGAVLAGRRSWLQIPLAGFLFVASLPVLFSVQERPLVPLAGKTASQSILVAPRQDLYFLDPYSQSAISSAVQVIRASRCSQVGLMLSGDSPEYLWWVMFGAPFNKSIRIEWMVSGTPTLRFQDPNFHPCAVVCTSCPTEWTQAFGLPLIYDANGIRLFGASNP